MVLKRVKPIDDGIRGQHDDILHILIIQLYYSIKLNRYYNYSSMKLITNMRCTISTKVFRGHLE